MKLPHILPVYLLAGAVLLPAAAVGLPEQQAGQARAAVAHWLSEAQGVEREFALLQVPAPQPAPGAAADLPESEDGSAVAVCDGGVLFNAENYDLVYVQNVRLNSPMLQLRAAQNLFVRLRRQSVSKEREEAAEKVNAVARGEQTPDELTPPNVEMPPPAPQQRCLSVRTGDAVADTESNSLILYAAPGAAPVEVSDAANRLVLHPTAAEAAYAVADAGGNVLLQAEHWEADWVDTRERRAHVEAQGPAYYDAAAATLYLSGQVSLKHPDGELRSRDGMQIRLRMQTPQPAAKDRRDFMQQFTDMRCEGIAAVKAQGAIEARYDAGGMSRMVKGEEFSYDAESGDCYVRGAGTTLVYGGSTLESDEGVHLLPNGDIELAGAPHGSYERPAQNGGEPLRGEWAAGGPLYFCAASGTITTERGMQMRDNESSFTCNGAVTLELERRPAAKANQGGQAATGKLNLAVAEYGAPQKLHAAGGVSARRYDPAAGKVNAMVQADEVHADLTTGEAWLKGTPESAALAEMNGSRLEAAPDGTTAPTLRLEANGDVYLAGAHINASFLDKDGNTVTAHCRDSLSLVRETATLTTGSETDFRAPQSIVTTNGPLTAHLAADTQPRIPNARWPQHHFSYSGIDAASTEQGGTVQTVQGSMQCSGRISLAMAPEAQKGAMGGLQTAVAEGQVAVAGRDSTGRMVRASGDRLVLDAATGDKVLTGQSVTLADEFNTHTASGGGAAVRIDARNNARITGGRHTTTATRLQEQINRNKKN